MNRFLEQTLRCALLGLAVAASACRSHDAPERRGATAGPGSGLLGRPLALRGVSLAVPAPTLHQTVETLLEHGRVRRGYLGIGAQPARLPEGLAKELGQETGLLLVSVDAGSPADKAGLVMGDTIVTFDGQPVRHLDDLLALLSGDRVGAEAPLRIVRGGELEEVSVVVGERA